MSVLQLTEVVLRARAASGLSIIAGGCDAAPTEAAAAAVQAVCVRSQKSERKRSSCVSGSTP